MIRPLFFSVAWLPVLLFGAGSLMLSPTPGAAQATPAPAGTDSLPLEFFGFRAGLTIPEMQLRAREASGTLSCVRAQRDLRLGECRGVLPELDSGRGVDVWISVIDGRGGVTLLSGRLTDNRFARWRELLEGRYGPTIERRQGPMRMLQWVRHRQMLRLSWRQKGRDVEVSVSLIDGALLDGWANQGRRPQASGPGPRDSTPSRTP